MLPKRHRLWVALLITLATLSACRSSPTDMPKAKAGIEVSAEIVTYCSEKENRYEPKCIQICIQDSGQAFCAVEAEARFTCPTDGNFKGVIPFSGADVAFPEILTPFEIDGDDLELGLASLGNMFITSKGSSVIITTDKEISFDAGAPVTSLAAIKKEETLYIIVGTSTDLRIVPSTVGDEIVVHADQMKSIALLGGIVQVVAKPSIDLSSAKSETAPGVAASINAPEEGTAAAAGASDINFAYLITADGDVWRAKISHLMNGGCLEKLYSASIHLDSAVHKIGARRIGVAGQYLAILASTIDSQLTEIPTLKKAWKSKIDGNPPTLIIDAFYRFAHKVALPEQSAQKIYTIDLMTSEDGNYQEMTMPNGAFISDILLAGDILLAAAYTYDSKGLPPYESSGNVIEDQVKIWNLARAGLAVTDNNLAHFVKTSGNKIFRQNILKPESLTTGTLPRPDIENPLVPPSLLLTIAWAGDRLFIRGENGYLAEVEMVNISAPSLVGLEDFIAGSPYQSIYHAATDTIATSFITAIEILNVKGLD